MQYRYKVFSATDISRWILANRQYQQQQQQQQQQRKKHNMAYTGITKYHDRTIRLFLTTRPDIAGDLNLNYKGNTLYSYFTPLARIIDHYHKNKGRLTNMNRRRRVCLVTTKFHTKTTRLQKRMLLSALQATNDIIWCSNVEANDEFAHNANVQAFCVEAKHLYLRGVKARSNTQNLIRQQEFVLRRLKAYCKYFKIPVPLLQRIANCGKVKVRLVLRRLSGAPAMSPSSYI